MSGGTVPPWLAEAADAVLADLFPGEVPPVEISWTPPAPDQELGSLQARTPDGEGMGYTIFADLRGEELRYKLASILPEYLPELTMLWARALPPCPGHVHPAVPDWDDATEQAWWQCPADLRRLARVGQLRDGAP